MRARLEVTAEVRRERGYTMNTAAIYAWILRTKPRVAVLVGFLLFWAVVFGSAGYRS
jgi:hypothetical protein